MANNNGIFHLQSRTLKPGESRMLMITPLHRVGEEERAHLDSLSEALATREAEEIYEAIRVLPISVLRKLRLMLPTEGTVPPTPKGRAL